MRTPPGMTGILPCPPGPGQCRRAPAACRRRTAAPMSLLRADTPQVLEGPNEDVAATDRQRGVGLFPGAQGVDGQQLVLRIGGEHAGFAVAHEQVEPAL